MAIISLVASMNSGAPAISPDGRFHSQDRIAGQPVRPERDDWSWVRRCSRKGILSRRRGKATRIERVAEVRREVLHRVRSA